MLETDNIIDSMIKAKELALQDLQLRNVDFDALNITSLKHS